MIERSPGRQKDIYTLITDRVHSLHASLFSHKARGDFVSRLELLRLGSTRTVLGCVCCQETVIAVRRILSKSDPSNPTEKSLPTSLSAV